MLRVLKLTVSNLILASIMAISVEAKKVPLLKTVSINIPVKEFSVVEFPFEIKDISFSSFKFKRKIKRKIKKSEALTFKNLNSSEKKNNNSKKSDILGLVKGVNLLRFNPKIKGRTEFIVWGHDEFPMFIKLNITDSNIADKNIIFVDTLNKRDDVIEFERDPHTKIIEKLTKSLYDENYKDKPSGYESVLRKASSEMVILDSKKKKVAVLHKKLIREIIGRKYKGQVWQLSIGNYYKKEMILNKVTKIQKEVITKVPLDKKMKINLVEKMFDSKGVYGVSLENYEITPEFNTRLMLVRKSI